MIEVKYNTKDEQLKIWENERDRLLEEKKKLLKSLISLELDLSQTNKEIDKLST